MTGLVIADDEEGVRRSLKRVLEKEGYAVFLAENGERAIDIVRDHTRAIDVIISDLRMPGKDGLQTLIEAGRLNPDMTRIMLTGYATMETAIDALNEGIDGFLMKPFSNSELRVKVREYTVKKRLRQFVSEQVYAKMQKGLEWMKIRRCEATVLFCDIRGFSRMSEQLTQDELSTLLNVDYFTPLDNIICDSGGMLDKHIGDSIMAVFGLLLSDGNPAATAVTCARKMMERMAEDRRVKTDGSLPIRIGIGISSGEVLAGLFGSTRKKEYTVFGSPVNIAARLESAAKSGEILVCEATRRAIGNLVTARKRESPTPRGIQGPMDIFEILLPGPH
ncbi:MAG: response regulator [Syntrophales bacterium]|jgi:class 3 adenylate cyclase|nr:response regulator [Syntrophales bacterium]MCK9528285.1 response regulator [Syntrophales bacterium]MDX9922417.1 adenylate/guanylate cyclase domain-containing protein [Syntrophales bacterium]